MTIETVLGDYRGFFADLLLRLDDAGIDIRGCSISHLAFRTETIEEYERVRSELETLSIANVENVWNGRPISKLLLESPLTLSDGFTAPLIELIPPEHQRDYPMGLEHAGVVIGDALEEFVSRHEPVLTGRQDQGPYCQPAYITFANDRTVKFYRYSLKDVVEKEGRRFVKV